MVELDLPEITTEFAALIPAQRMAIGLLMSAGTITSYTLSADRRRLWVTFVASTEEEVRAALTKFPILPFTRWNIIAAMFSELALIGVSRVSMN
jgi:hypothetical protein